MERDPDRNEAYRIVAEHMGCAGRIAHLEAENEQLRRRLMPRNAQDLRMQARDMERDAQEIERLTETIDFLTTHKEAPNIEIHFPGFARDGDQAANEIANWVTCEWAKRKAILLEQFRGRLNDLKAKWD